MKRKNNFPASAGIYLIRNVINDKIYIGSTSNLKIRRNKHISDLKNNKHHSYHLQKAYNKYGESNFQFIIIELIENTNDINTLKNILIELEQKYIVLYDSCNSDMGYKKFKFKFKK